MKLPTLAQFFDLQYVRVGNFWYFFFIIAIALSVIVLDNHCKKKGMEYTDHLVLTLVWINFGLHFLKQFFPGYRDKWPYGFADSLAPNLCAGLIFLSPFIMLWGRPSWKDYLYYIGVVSGIAAISIPTGAMRYADYPEGFGSIAYVLEVGRFYFCHAVLILAGYLMVARGTHKISFQRIKWIPLVFAFFFALVGVHAILWGPIAKLPEYPHDWFGEDGVLYNLNIHQQISNQSMVYGPQPAIDSIVASIARFFPGLAVYYVDSRMYYVPIIWMAPTLLLLIAVFGPLVTYPFDKLGVKSAIEERRQKKKMAKERT